MDARQAAQGAGMTLGIAAAGMAARLAWRSPPLALARMSGTSITAPDAVGWVTDFLNAAYYARQPELRDVEDLRLAFAILTTRWHQHGHRRLHAHDVLAFHRSFFRERILDSAHTPRGTLDREQLFTGAARLIGPWFEEAYGDDERRAHGIVFETTQARDAYKPEHRLRQGHFMGRARNRLLAYELDGRANLRAAGTWDDMPVTLEQAYRSAGRKAQQAFWGEERPESSMLAQIADRTA